MFIVLGYTYLFCAMLDSPLDFEGKGKDKFPTVCLCVLLLFPDDISKSLSAFFFVVQFCSTTKKNLKETPIGFYIKNLWSCHPLPFLLMLCMKTNRFRYCFVLKDYVFSLINIWVCPKLFHLVKRIKTRGIGNISFKCFTCRFRLMKCSAVKHTGNLEYRRLEPSTKPCYSSAWNKGWASLSAALS